MNRLASARDGRGVRLPRLFREGGLAALLALACLPLMSAPVAAQWFRHAPLPFEDVMSPREVSEVARRYGFRPVGRPSYRGDFVGIDAVDRAGVPVRLTFEGYSGYLMHVALRHRAPDVEPPRATPPRQPRPRPEEARPTPAPRPPVAARPAPEPRVQPRSEPPTRAPAPRPPAERAPSAQPRPQPSAPPAAPPAAAAPRPAQPGPVGSGTRETPRRIDIAPAPVEAPPRAPAPLPPPAALD